LVEEVDAIDRSPLVIARAQSMPQTPANLRFIDGDFLSLAAQPYDFISFVASLHHMQWVDALKKAQSLLQPGGVIGIIGLYRVDGGGLCPPKSAREVRNPSRVLGEDRGEPTRDFVRDVAAFTASQFLRLQRGRAGNDNVPLAAPRLTFDETRRTIHALLPGAVVRRHMLWRYTAIWKKCD
jgi:hypothetical protein